MYKTHANGDGSTKRAMRLGLEFISSIGGDFSSSSYSIIVILLPLLFSSEDLTFKILNSLFLIEFSHFKDSIFTRIGHEVILVLGAEKQENLEGKEEEKKEVNKGGGERGEFIMERRGAHYDFVSYNDDVN